MKCARTACTATRDVLCRHKETGAYYCPRCARKINEATPGLVEWPKDILKARQTPGGDPHGGL